MLTRVISQNVMTTIKNIIEILTEEEKPILPIHEKKSSTMPLKEILVIQSDIESNTASPLSLSPSSVKSGSFKYF